MRYKLLTIKANDKAYITHTSDSLILSLVDYYEHDGDPAYLGEAYYYAGSTYKVTAHKDGKVEIQYKSGSGSTLTTTSAAAPRSWPR